MGAFDWSPGGCCCGTQSWFFDALNSNNVNTQRFTRACSIYPNITAHNAKINSDTRGGWSISSTLGPVVAFTGYHADGQFAWMLADRSVTTSDRFISYVDLEGRQELFAWPSGGSFLIRGQNIGPVFSSSQFTALEGSQLNVYDSGGGLTVTQLSSGSGPGGVNSPPGFGGQFETLPNGDYHSRQIGLFANADYPYAGGFDITYQQGFPGSMPFAYKQIKFVHGRSAVVGGQFIVGSEIISTVNYPPPYLFGAAAQAFAFYGYDHFGDHWAAVIGYDQPPATTTPRHNRLEIIIDGISVFVKDDFIAADSSQYSFDHYALTRSPHICYPHETLGSGYVAVIQQATGGSEMHVYRDGALVWKTNSSGNVNGIYGSTDRWIYFTSLPTPINQMTNGEFDSQLSAVNGTGVNWLARHDGSQILPATTLTDTHGRFYERFTGTGGGFNYNGLIRKSSVVPNPLPASYQEMYDQRNG